MKYSLVNGERSEARTGLSGQCQTCGRQTIAKCGEVKIWHWAHSGKRMCDPWWENETEWHRAWKGQFPKEYQEIIQYAENGEKHIADVKIDQGYVIEFQWSHIKPEERQAREDFYKKMVWVVGGTRRSKDKDKFNDVLKCSVKVDGNEALRSLGSHFNKFSLLSDWASSKVPVFFDFGDDILWGLLPKTIEGGAYAFRIERNTLITSLRPEPQINYSFEAILKGWTNLIEQEQWYQRRKKIQKIQRTPALLRWPLIK